MVRMFEKEKYLSHWVGFVHLTLHIYNARMHVWVTGASFLLRNKGFYCWDSSNLDSFRKGGIILYAPLINCLSIDCKCSQADQLRCGYLHLVRWFQSTILATWQYLFLSSLWMKLLLDKASSSGSPFLLTGGELFLNLLFTNIFFLEIIARLAHITQLSRRLHPKSDWVTGACFLKSVSRYVSCCCKLILVCMRFTALPCKRLSQSKLELTWLSMTNYKLGWGD